MKADEMLAIPNARLLELEFQRWVVARQEYDMVGMGYVQWLFKLKLDYQDNIEAIELINKLCRKYSKIR